MPNISLPNFSPEDLALLRDMAQWFRTAKRNNQIISEVSHDTPDLASGTYIVRFCLNSDDEIPTGDILESEEGPGTAGESLHRGEQPGEIALQSYEIEESALELDEDDGLLGLWEIPFGLAEVMRLQPGKGDDRTTKCEELKDNELPDEIGILISLEPRKFIKVYNCTGLTFRVHQLALAIKDAFGVYWVVSARPPVIEDESTDNKEDSTE